MMYRSDSLTTAATRLRGGRPIGRSPSDASSADRETEPTCSGGEDQP